MIYSEPLSSQISRFLDSVGMGFLLCALYVVIKVLFRVTGKGKIAVMISDGVFCLIIAFVSFFYMIMENGGTVRLNLIIGQLIGGLTLYFTVGRLVLKILYLPADAINGLLRLVTYPIRVTVKTLLGLPVRLFVFVKVRLKADKKAKKAKKEKNLDKKINLL